MFKIKIMINKKYKLPISRKYPGEKRKNWKP